MKKTLLIVLLILGLFIGSTVGEAMEFDTSELAEVPAMEIEREHGGDGSTIEIERAEVGAGEDIAANAILYNAYFKVYSDSGKPIEGAAISIGGEVVAVTGSGGLAQVERTNGQFDYTVSKSGYESASGSAVIEDASINISTIRLKKMDHVEFTVTSGGVAVAGAAITFDGRSKTTSSSGTAAFWSRDGSFSYSVTHENFKTATGTVDVAGDVAVEVELSGAYLAAFNVVDDLGASLGGVSINVDSSDTVVTGSDGTASLWVEKGSHSYVAGRDGYDNAAGEFYADSSLKGVNIEMTRKKYVAAFTVTDENEVPINQAKISMPDNIVFTDADGNAQIQGLLPGTYDVNVSKDGYIDYMGEIQVVDATVRAHVVLAQAPEPPPPEPTPTPAPTARPTTRPTSRPTPTPSVVPTKTPRPTPSSSKTPVIASLMPSPSPSAGAPASPSPSPSPTEGKELLSVGFNIVDENGDPMADVETELHSESKKGRTDGDGYIFYLDVEPGAHTFYVMNDDGTARAQKDFVIEYSSATRFETGAHVYDDVFVKTDLNSVTMDMAVEGKQIDIVGVHEGWSPFYSELPSGGNSSQPFGEGNMTLWLIGGVALLLTLVVVFIAVRKRSGKVASSEDDIETGGQ